MERTGKPEFTNKLPVLSICITGQPVDPDYFKFFIADDLERRFPGMERRPIDWTLSYEIWIALAFKK